MGLKFLCDELPKYIQDPDILDTVATSRGACSASINILTDLLTFDKIEDGQLKLDRQEVSVKELVHSSTAIFQAQVLKFHVFVAKVIVIFFVNCGRELADSLILIPPHPAS